MAALIVLGLFRTHFNQRCRDRGLPEATESIDHLEPDDLRDMTLRLLGSFLLVPVPDDRSVADDLRILTNSIRRPEYNLERIKPSLRAALADQPDVEQFYDLLHEACADVSTPPRTIASSLAQTPIRRASSGTHASQEYRRDIDSAIRAEIRSVVGDSPVPTSFFTHIPGLDEVAQVVLEKCREGDNPLFDQGWRNWPDVTLEKRVLPVLIDIVEHLTRLAQPHMSKPPGQKLMGGLADKILDGAYARRKTDIAFVANDAEPGSVKHWSQIYVAGELKKSPGDDKDPGAWFNFARYSREILFAQDERRYVLGFTLCGTSFRILSSDRLGVVASCKFDIQEEPLPFIRFMLGFVFMDRPALGFDPTIISLGGKRFIEIESQGQTRRLFLRSLISRAEGIAIRATTCWEAYFEDEPQVPLLLKESWQPPERDEGAMLRLATEKGVSNVPRHVHDWTLYVDGRVDDVQGNIRNGWVPPEVERSAVPNLPAVPSRHSRSLPGSQSRRSSGRKRTASQAGLAQEVIRPRLISAKTENPAAPTNRIRRRILMRDVGKPIFQFSSLVELLECLAQAIAGHADLLSKARVLHRDISPFNLLINLDHSDPRRSGLLIDLDHAILTSREEPSGTKSRTGTWAFIAIGALMGEPHSFMHDLESFFWVIFWLVVHYDGEGKFVTHEWFEDWHYIHDAHQLARVKQGVIGAEDLWAKTLEEYVGPYCAPLKKCLSELRKIVFPDNQRHSDEDMTLYQKMEKTLRDARNDPGVNIEVVG